VPVQWSISHPKRLVIAVAKGKITPEEIAEYFDGVTKSGGMAYGKVFEIADIESTLTAENMSAFGDIVRHHRANGKAGPVAIVAEFDRGYQQARLFASAAKAERPLAIFREWHEGRRWLDSMMAAE
jgi:hypothetical protein